MNALFLASLTLAGWLAGHPELRPVTEEVRVAYEQYHAGMTILNRVVPSLATSYSQLSTMAKKANEATKAALTEAKEELDDAGAALSEYISEPVDLGAFAKDSDSYNELRIEAISDCESAQEGLESCLNKLKSLPETPALKALIQDIQLEQEDIQSAFEELGGDPTEGPLY